MKVLLCLFLPFLGTSLGASLVYFIRKELNKKIEIIILGFAAGVMLAASFWSLLLPALELASIWIVVLGLICGVTVFKGIDYLCKKKNIEKDKVLLAINIHNIPEGMAVGVMIASFLAGQELFTSCLCLSLGIALQNIPEGLVVSLPEWKKGKAKTSAFLQGVLSAFYELVGAVLTLLFTQFVSGVLPFFLSFAASAMLYVIVSELIPESSNENKSNMFPFLVGFLLMMILDCLF